eukprot:365771-Chlamydomonas_euryale.AAC.4
MATHPALPEAPTPHNPLPLPPLLPPPPILPSLGRTMSSASGADAPPGWATPALWERKHSDAASVADGARPPCAALPGLSCRVCFAVVLRSCLLPE